MGHGKEAVRKRLHNSLSSCVEVESETQPVLFAGQPLLIHKGLSINMSIYHLHQKSIQEIC